MLVAVGSEGTAAVIAEGLTLQELAVVRQKSALSLEQELMLVLMESELLGVGAVRHLRLRARGLRVLLQSCCAVMDAARTSASCCC